MVLSLALTGAAMTTTAVGTLIPILGDAGELRTRFGTYLLGAGAVGEFGPILMITLFLSTGRPLASAVILIAFVIVSVLVALVAVRSMGSGWKLVEQTMEGSSQLGVRLAVVLVFLLAFLAAELGLDLLLGGFMAGAIVRLALQGREVAVFESKLTAVGYGFFIPFFFVVSGIKLDVGALAEDPIRLLELPLFLACFLVVRGGAGAAALPQGAGRARPAVAGVLLGHRAAADRGHHDRRRGARRDARVHGRVAGGRRHPVHQHLPAGRAQAPRRPLVGRRRALRLPPRAAEQVAQPRRPGPGARARRATASRTRGRRPSPG